MTEDFLPTISQHLLTVCMHHLQIPLASLEFFFTKYSRTGELLDPWGPRRHSLKYLVRHEQESLVMVSSC